MRDHKLDMASKLFTFTFTFTSDGESGSKISVRLGKWSRGNCGECRGSSSPTTGQQLHAVNYLHLHLHLHYYMLHCRHAVSSDGSAEPQLLPPAPYAKHPRTTFTPPHHVCHAGAQSYSHTVIQSYNHTIIVLVS